MNVTIQLTHLFYQYGPFALSLIILIIMARWGQSIWEKANTRTPPASGGEKAVYAGVFIVLILFGLVLSAISVYWWWTHRPLYWYESQISELSETDTIEGDRLFVRNKYYQHNAGPQFRDVHLLLVQSAPFVDGQKVVLKYSKDHERVMPLELLVTLNERTEFGIEFRDADKAWKLVRRGGSPSSLLESREGRSAASLWAALLPAAFAQAPSNVKSITPSSPSPMLIKQSVDVGKYQSVPIAKTATRPTTWTSDLEPAVEALQDPAALVSTKLRALDKVTNASLADRGNLFNLDFAEPSRVAEPAFLTIADMTRHTDQEVASKARWILSNSPLPALHFAELLESKSAARKSQAVKEFLRLDPQYAELVLKELNRRGVDASMLKQVAAPGDQWQLVVPTGTSAGDKYFVKADWDAKDTAAATCLSGVFPKDPNAAPGAKSEQLVGAQRVNRYLADNDKNKALNLAAAIQKCGGKATFVGFYPGKK
jgi:hypothetical protein